MAAVSRSERVAATLASSRNAFAGTAACAFVQDSHAFIFDTRAAINSRSPTDQAEGPRIASWVSKSHGSGNSQPQVLFGPFDRLK